MCPCLRCQCPCPACDTSPSPCCAAGCPICSRSCCYQGKRADWQAYQQDRTESRVASKVIPPTRHTQHPCRPMQAWRYTSATPGQHEQHCTETPVRDTCRGGGAAAGDRVRRPGRRWRAESHRRLPTPSCAARVTHARCPGETRSPAVFPPLHTPAPCTHTTSPTAHREKAVGGSHAVSVRRQ